MREGPRFLSTVFGVAPPGFAILAYFGHFWSKLLQNFAKLDGILGQNIYQPQGCKSRALGVLNFPPNFPPKLFLHFCPFLPIFAHFCWFSRLSHFWSHFPVFADFLRFWSILLIFSIFSIFADFRHFCPFFVIFARFSILDFFVIFPVSFDRPKILTEQ